MAKPEVNRRHKAFMSPSQHQIGCSDLPPGMKRSKYFEKLAFLEISAFFTSRPARKAVRSWREKSPETARYALIASSELTHGKQCLPVDEAAANEVSNLADSCSILQAEAIVFRTPASFTPSATNRDRLQQFFSEVATAERFGETRRVWHPDGLWEPNSISEVAQAAGVLAAIDPLAHDPLEEFTEFVAREMARGEAYLRVSGLGHSRPRFESYQLEMLAEMLMDVERSWTAFAHPGMYPDALAMQRQLAQELE